ncbi:MAG: hypothetical protein A2Y14_01790 [Verrucomicrobia bacterium GWF2_51_19]|nr:MAG: hypothetical protein A2Y14_01790 [Verrucomicrobia bacterium GWF2_51_19]HCJ12472.1 chemotaxis protein CheW [Opitutae bacterium]
MNDSLQKVLTFQVKGVMYGIDILKVREIVGRQTITPLPDSDKHVCGVINLRGSIIPVIDLASCFHNTFVEETPKSCIVVVDGHERTGILVDAVCHVESFTAQQIDKACGVHSSKHYVLGVAKSAHNEVVLLDLDYLLRPM